MADQDNSDPPQNFSEDIEELKVRASGVTAVDDNSEVGILTIVMRNGHYDFLINQEIGNMIVQHLREFIRGDSKKLDDDPA
jgi:hypothetical protein